ncbi:MAG: hypothetical protein JNJ83_12890 [Verrucomicrobiaceae bacterium]|nr:hypothetical protein [Verrucomicrobiaceae bacterium]
MKLPIIVSVAWAALWLMGSWWSALGIQGELQASVAGLLDQVSEEHPGLAASVRGQNVYLSGTVRESADLTKVTRLLQESARLNSSWSRGTSLSAMRAVNGDAVRIDSRSSGWGIVLADATQATIYGVVNDDAEALRIASQLRPVFGGVNIVSRLEADAEAVVREEELTDTSAVEEIVKMGRAREGVLAIAQWGSAWKPLDLGLPRERLRRALQDFGISDSLWNEQLAGEVIRLQSLRDQAIAKREMETKSQQLAPGHVVMAVRADTILVRGELAIPTARDLFLQRVGQLAGSRRVINQLRISDRRKPEPDIRPLIEAMPSLPEGNLARWVAVGSIQDGWKVVPLAEIDVEDANTIMPAMLPASVDHRLMIVDVADAAIWVYSIASEPVTHAPKRYPAHLFLAFAGLDVFVRGCVPNEALRTQAEQAVRKRYPQLEADIQIEVDTQCEAGESPLQTLGLLPVAPGADTSGLLAFAVVGEPWSTKSARASLLEAQTLAASGLLPKDFPVNLVMPEVLDVAPALMAHFRVFERTAPVGIPPQIIGPQ